MGEFLTFGPIFEGENEFPGHGVNTKSVDIGLN